MKTTGHQSLLALQSYSQGIVPCYLMKLLLFDIDGTLVDTGGTGRGALQAGMRIAFPEESARREMPALDLAGATDGGVTRFLFQTFGVPYSVENERHFLGAYLRILKERLTPPELSPPGGVLAGVTDLLEQLNAKASATVALLTGNTRAGAEVKMAAYTLAHHFDFDCGAYGCDHWDRDQLGPVAVKRATAKKGHAFAENQVIVVGDTPKDISCGKAIGARTVAVATGGFDREALEAFDPDYVLDDLSDVQNTLAILLEEAEKS